MNERSLSTGLRMRNSARIAGRYWGTHDKDVLPGQSEAMALALRQAGFNVRQRPVQGATHFWFSEQDPTEAGSVSAQLAPDLLRFLRLHLRGRDA